ncbi:MAG: response regulator [Syntrophobacteraceae bacterium]
MDTKTGSALVIGAGVSGIRSALDLAEMDYRVFLIDKAPQLGGTLSQLDYQFPSDHCGMCKMLPTTDRDASSQFCLRKGLFHKNIEIMLGTELAALEGNPGNFRATLTTAPSFIDAERCIGCAECSSVCPVEVPDDFNAGLTRRKAVYLPVPHNIPNRYVVDMAACTRCGECQKVCPTGAINLRLDARRTFRVLVVDDELILRESLRDWLIEEGFSVDMAESGKAAVELLSQNEYGLMLLDIKMPGMDGVEVLTVAKEMRETLPVIMMTAYATVETAVDAMKIGALDYLMKPFDIEALISKVVQQYERTLTVTERQVEVGAVIMATGSGFADPSQGLNTYEYKVLPNVITSIEFERLISGTGPNAGKLLRPSDGKPAVKIAWLQCVGSRNLQQNADYCSSVCCMFSIKEALLAKSRMSGEADTAIFYMDMRTFGKDFQRYRDTAERELGVRFVRSRVHSVEPGAEGSLRLHYMDAGGRDKDESFDLVVLAAGQKPPAGSEALAELSGIELNQWGFCRTGDFSPSRTSKEGIFAGGSFSGLKDISESLIQAGSASVEASTLIHSKGGSLRIPGREETAHRDVSRERQRAAVALCTCGGALAGHAETLAAELGRWTPGTQCFEIEQICTEQGWSRLSAKLKESGSNTITIGACMPCAYGRKLTELGHEIGLSPALMDVVDIRTPALRDHANPDPADQKHIEALLKMSLEKLRGANPLPSSPQMVTQRALVIGGGIAGMTAALAIADHGFKVELVEKSDTLGGLARHIQETIDGISVEDLLEKRIAEVESHPNISVHTGGSVIHSQPSEGNFLTTIEVKDKGPQQLEHGAVILATGGREAQPKAYCYGQSEAILTQHELEARLKNGVIKPAQLKSVAMIQCVGSREEGRNYCSRVCCTSALKNALHLKEKNPELDIVLFYRDIMTYGFLETHYTRARREGIIFIQYTPERKPDVSVTDGHIQITANDPILGRDIVIEPDLLVLATGIVPDDQRTLAGLLGIELNEDGFFREAEYKWQPVNSRRRGVFLCGVAHSPRSIPESIAMAQAAAQRALGMLNREKTEAGSLVAHVRHSLCSLCERCVSACPYNARRRNEDEDIIEIDQLACQGCGSCASICPNSASFIQGFEDRQMMAMLDAALE